MWRQSLIVRFETPPSFFRSSPTFKHTIRLPYYRPPHSPATAYFLSIWCLILPVHPSPYVLSVSSTVRSTDLTLDHYTPLHGIFESIHHPTMMQRADMSDGNERLELRGNDTCPTQFSRHFRLLTVSHRRTLYGLSLNSKSNQHSFLSYPPTMIWSPVGWTSKLDIHLIPGKNVFSSCCAVRSYIRIYRCVLSPLSKLFSIQPSTLLDSPLRRSEA